ncbi:YkvA family protein [Jiella marina]|uniref:YkvA family protein n=1 Tax=Jiella sp. LLJ827 TaxID=2917712 RepID=UPI0021016FA3|nr:DUF1232 domain-containing protein [Jiella sp. LLJ827]MCQ0986201.1 DUF1232 domain-containing protein [Jiella sp. LLJ827]
MSRAYDRLRNWARALRRDGRALWIVARDPRTPRIAKLLAVVIAAYALSPIDLIPDFIPVLGLLDDLLILPLGIFLVVKLVPAELMKECRRSTDTLSDRAVGRAGMVLVVALWSFGLLTMGFWGWRWWMRP